MEFHEMEQYVQIDEIESMMQSINSNKVMLIDMHFYSIYLQLLYQHHEREEHEHNFPENQNNDWDFFFHSMVKSHIWS